MFIVFKGFPSRDREALGGLKSDAISRRIGRVQICYNLMIFFRTMLGVDDSVDGWSKIWSFPP